MVWTLGSDVHAYIKGVYFDGKTSKKTEAILYYRDDGRIGIEGSHKQPVSLNALTISPRIGSTARYIEFPDGGQFETDNNDAVDLACERLEYKDSQGFIHVLESRKRFVLATVVFVVLFAWGFVQYGVPAMSKQLALMVPDEASQYIGQGVLDVLDEHWLKPTTFNKERRSELRSLFRGYADSFHESLGLNIVFRQGGRLEANAFALPDGTIVFTDELVELAENNLEIGSVMLHEIGHIYYRHSLRAAIQQFSLVMLLMALTGDVSASSSVITGLPALLVETGYSRAMEWEADGFALEYMQKNSIDPEHFASMMEKLDARYTDTYKECVSDNRPVADCLTLSMEALGEDREQGIAVEGYLSTHPASEQRAARFRERRAH